MDTQHLSCFLALCDRLNYTAAADDCFISRQAMRQIIQKLEAEYGLPLIQNHRNKLSLTPAGELLRQKAQRVVDAYAELESAMRACRAPSQPLRIGVSSSLLPFYVPAAAAALDQFPEAYPGIALQLSVIPADEAISQLLLGELDAAVVVDAGRVPLPLSRTELRQDPLRLLLCASHPLAQRSALRYADLDGLTLDLMSDPSVCFEALSSAIAQAGARVHYRIVPEYSDVCLDVRSGLAIGLDRGNSAPLPSIGHYRLLPLAEDPLFLHTVLLAQPDVPPAVSLAAAYLRSKVSAAPV